MLIKLMRGLIQFKNQPFKDLEELFTKLSTGQNPDTLLITCSDSRIVPSLMMQAEPGDLFSIRNIGNIIPVYPSDSSEAGAIEFALKALKIKDIIICGHSHCGAIKGLLAPNLDHLPSVKSWLKNSQQVVDELRQEHHHEEIYDSAEELTAAIKKNIILQMEHLKTYPLLLEKVQNNELTLHGWYYEIETGKVFVYDFDDKDFINLEDALIKAKQVRMQHIISRLCVKHLQPLTPIKSIENYHRILHSISSLEQSTQPIWADLEASAIEEIWTELGDFYTSREDSEFQKMIQSCAQMPAKLKDFKQHLFIADDVAIAVGLIPKEALNQIPQSCARSHGEYFLEQCQFNKHLERLDQKIVDFTTRDEEKACDEMTLLKTKLSQYRQQFLESDDLTPSKTKTFYSKCTEAINDSREELDKHRGIELILVLFLKALDYVCNQVSHGYNLSFFAPKTKAAVMIDELNTDLQCLVFN